MNWLNIQETIWEDPLSVAAGYATQDMTLLYSGMREAHTGRYSYLFLNPIATHEDDAMEQLPATAQTDDLPDWVGYLGYELYPSPAAVVPSPIALPAMRFVRYGHLLRFDHTAQTIGHYTRKGHTPNLPAPHGHVPAVAAKIRALSSNQRKTEYLDAVANTIRHIEAGDFYQANITRKFFGSFSHKPDAFSLFQKLTHTSPAPYSAYIRHGKNAILSASPECFMRVDRTGTITTRPIKGSARRGADAAQDEQIRAALQTSSKNLSENLMIVDLMRNDLARVSTPESVTVEEQSGLYSYATIHHLISTIRAEKRPDSTLVDLLTACFPPGSMTGAPKRAAIRWCAEQEKMARGVYSGAIGWLGAQDSCDLSVVIRTLLIEDDRFEFQVGGGIVADSDPEEEWQETLTKARGIAAALGLSETDLAAL